MMSELLDCSVIGSLVAALLILSITLFVGFSGLLTQVHISTGSPPLSNITVAYKFSRGSNCGLLLSESRSLAPQLPTFTIFYDQPEKVTGPKCRCVVGSILSEGDQKPSIQLQELYEKSGFQFFNFPKVTHVVFTSFPYRTPLSVFLGKHRVYDQLQCYIKDKKLCAHPLLEIYRGQLIHYISPLARQGDFYVPEVQQTSRRKQQPEESDEDRMTDITDAGTHSKCSSLSCHCPSESRDSSLALSRFPSALQQEQRDSVSTEHSGSDSAEEEMSRRNSCVLSLDELQPTLENIIPSYCSVRDKFSCQHEGLVVEGEE